jgi:hypothetical protein
MTTSEVRNWSPIQWASIAYAKPSGGGAVGVVFVWAKAGVYNNPGTASFVIKPIKGGASPTKFAEHMLANLAGASSPNSKPIARNSLEGNAIINTLKIFRSTENDATTKSRWNQVMTHYETADNFLIQETQTGIKEFGDEYRVQGGLRSILKDKTLMTNLGRLFVADAMIGNGDRLCNPNMGNIVFKPNGQVSSIDSAAILNNFNAVLNDITYVSHPNTAIGTVSAKQWGVDGIIKVGSTSVPGQTQVNAYNQGKQPVVAPTFNMSTIFDKDQWWENVFKAHIINGMTTQSQVNAAQGIAPLIPPKPQEWTDAKAWFMQGVDEGMREIDSKLSGINWLLVKNKFKNYTSKYGADANLDWTNFKIRRRYVKALLRTKNEAMAVKDV